MRYVTERRRELPRGRTPEGELALSNAERQALYRARQKTSQPRVAIKRRKPVDRRSRPQRWNDALAEIEPPRGYGRD
jgi:hypothetical protein